MKIKLTKTIRGHERNGIIAGRVLEVYDGLGKENASEGQVWVRCPRRKAGYMRLEREEFLELG